MLGVLLDRSPRPSVSNFRDRVGGGSVNIGVELNRFANRIQSRPASGIPSPAWPWQPLKLG